MKNKNNNVRKNHTQTQHGERRRNQFAYLESPEAWWSKVPPGQRRFMQEIATALSQVDETIRLEVRCEDGVFRARYIEILDKPEEGCLSALIPVVGVGEGPVSGSN